jgi:hypothetical protein
MPQKRRLLAAYFGRGEETNSLYMSLRMPVDAVSETLQPLLTQHENGMK